MFVLYRSKLRTPTVIKDRGCRTQAQFEAVAKLMPEVDFICGNPFEVEFAGQEFNCTFNLPFYHNGELRMGKVTPTGRMSFLDMKTEKYVKELI